MKELEVKLRELQRQKYEVVPIGHVLEWMAQIRRDNRAKRIKK